jgi:hypothetical protein
MIDSIRSHSTRIDAVARQDARAVSSQVVASAQAGSATATVSVLARQLAASAAQAEERDRTLSRSELGERAQNILDKITGDAFYANKSRHDSEVPKTDDPELLARAKQASAFLDSISRGGGSAGNPFAGLSQDQLALIAYDDSGAYTVNERHAAWRESYEQEQVWRRQVAAQALAEYNDSGKLTNFFSAVLEHYKELPAIEQAQYPEHYAMDLESKIRLDFNYRTNQAEGQGKDPMSLIDMLFKPASPPAPRSP